MYFILKGRKLRFGASIFQNLVGGPQTSPSPHWLKQDSWKKMNWYLFFGGLAPVQARLTFFKKFLRLRNSHRYASGPCCKLTMRAIKKTTDKGACFSTRLQVSRIFIIIFMIFALRKMNAPNRPRDKILVRHFHNSIKFLLGEFSGTRIPIVFSEEPVGQGCDLLAESAARRFWKQGTGVP